MIVEFEAGTIWDADGVRITAFEVDHRPVVPAFGFLFETAGCRVAFSGDTSVCEGLVRAAAGVDLLVHECFLHQAMLARRGGRADRGLGNVAAYHTLSSEVGKVATRAGARMLLLNHFVPVDFDREALLREVRADYRGPIVIGEDLLTIDVPRPDRDLPGPASWARLGLSRPPAAERRDQGAEQNHEAERGGQAEQLGEAADRRRADQEAEIADRADRGDRSARRHARACAPPTTAPPGRRRTDRRRPGRSRATASHSVTDHERQPEAAGGERAASPHHEIAAQLRDQAIAGEPTRRHHHAKRRQRRRPPWSCRRRGWR